MGVFFCPFNLALSVQISYNVRMKEERIEIRADEGFVEKVDYLQRINDYKNRSDTVRKVVEKEYVKETLEGSPASINITGINGKGYVRIVQMFEFPTYYRYDLDVYDEHGDAVSVYIPKKEKEDGR